MVLIQVFPEEDSINFTLKSQQLNQITNTKNKLWKSPQCKSDETKPFIVRSMDPRPKPKAHAKKLGK